MLASCTAQTNAQLRIFSPNHLDISPHLGPLSFLSLCLLSLLSGAQTKDAGLLGRGDDMDRWWHGECGFVGIGVVEGVGLWRSASVVDISVCV